VIWELRDTPRFSADETELLAEGWEPFHGFQIGSETWIVFRRLRVSAGWTGFAPVGEAATEDTSWHPLAGIETEAVGGPGCLIAIGLSFLAWTLIALLLWWLL